MYHEAVHVFGGHTGCDKNIYNTSNGKDRDYVSVYGTHINLNFQLSISPYLSCDERKYIFNVGQTVHLSFPHIIWNIVRPFVTNLIPNSG